LVVMNGLAKGVVDEVEGGGSALEGGSRETSAWVYRGQGKSWKQIA
jgi:hypothetical protein